MGLQAEIVLLCIIIVVWIQQILCDGISITSVTNWTCTCSIAHQEKLNVVPLDCYSSCDCSHASGEHKWTCICPVDGLPKVVGDDTGNSCFTACNCNAGTLTELQPSNKRIFGEAIVIALLSCLILIVLSFIASLIWYSFRNDTRSVLWPSYSSHIPPISSTVTNLISQGAASSVSAYKGHYYNSPVRSSIGCLPKKCFRIRSRTGSFQGTIIQFSYSDLESATNRFSPSNLIGVGGSSHVYHGNLRDGRTVAIKRMRTQAGPDAEQLFLSEIELISRLHHCHVVPLLGYCSEYQGKNVERLLVFDYIPNGNLRECLDGNSGQSLDWSARVSIALGAARGLEYLHEAAAPRILHRDVKSTNILLDENWRAKITDLGMATHLQNDGVLSSDSPAGMQGTFGYFAPEYAIIGRASLKSDVFSFGVVLLELITGRKPIQKSSKGEESLVIWATPRLQNSKRVILELPDPRLKGDFEEEEMHVMAYLAKECLLMDPESRPTMGEVVQVLSTIAPDRSRRSNFPGHASQYSSTSQLRSTNSEMVDEEFYETSCAPEEIKQITCEMPAGCLSPRNHPGINLNIINSEKKEADNPPNDVEKLMGRTKKVKSWQIQEERVDLTEPRMEAFCLPNVDSHIVVQVS